jgi:glycosyltransferase involved in cell wall biosynthesis
MRDQESAPIEKQLRVLNVTLDYPPPLSGGYGVICAQVCTWLKQRGHEVLVLTALPQEPGIDSADPDAEECAVSVRRILRSYWDGSACLDLPFQEALAVEQHNQEQMRDVLATYHPDVVAFWHRGAMSLGLITTTARLGYPLVFFIGDDWLCYGGWTDAWLRWCNAHPEQRAAVERHTGLPTQLPDLGTMGHFCFVSALTKRRAEQIGGWHLPRAEIIFPGLSPTEFPLLVEVPDHPWGWRLLWVGRVIEEKGIETAIHALSLLPLNATLEIVGMVHPVYHQHLEALATTLGVASRLSFSLASRQQMRQRYQQADVTLFTSKIEHEAFGLVPLEAMASGCPVIATGVGGSGEYCLDGVNCIHVSPGDPTALADAVRQLAQSRDLLRRLVEGGLRTASTCTLDHQAAGIERSLLALQAFPVHNQSHRFHHYCLGKDGA